MNPSDHQPAVPVSDAPPTADAAAARTDLERALAEVDRLTQEVKGHTSTKSTAERQAADLASLRKFHEKALSQVDRLTTEKAVLAEEKGSLVKQLADATAARRAAEQARADADKLVQEAKQDKAALEKKVAELQVPRPGLAPPPPSTKGGLNAPPRVLDAAPPVHEAAPPPEGAPEPDLPEPPDDAPPGGPAPHPLAETKEIPIIPIPLPPGKGRTPDKIRYLCGGCGRKLGAPPEFAGTFGTCKFCGHRGTVPTSSTR